MTFVARIADGVGLEAQGIDSSRARCRQSIASVHLCARNLESVQKSCWDVSGDGSVTSLDALMILQAAAHAIDL